MLDLDAPHRRAGLGTTQKHPRAARRLAAQAYTLWYRDYFELMTLGRFLMRSDPRVLLLFPGVRMAVTHTQAKVEASPDAEELEAPAEAEGEELLAS